MAWSLEAENLQPLESKFLELLVRRGLKPVEEIAQQMKPLPAAGEADDQADSSSSLITPP